MFSASEDEAPAVFTPKGFKPLAGGKCSGGALRDHRLMAFIPSGWVTVGSAIPWDARFISWESTFAGIAQLHCQTAV